MTDHTHAGNSYRWLWWSTWTPSTALNAQRRESKFARASKPVLDRTQSTLRGTAGPIHNHRNVAKETQGGAIATRQGRLPPAASELHRVCAQRPRTDGDCGAGHVGQWTQAWACEWVDKPAHALPFSPLREVLRARPRGWDPSTGWAGGYAVERTPSRARRAPRSTQLISTTLSAVGIHLTTRTMPVLRRTLQLSTQLCFERSRPLGFDVSLACVFSSSRSCFMRSAAADCCVFFLSRFRVDICGWASLQLMCEAGECMCSRVQASWKVGVSCMHAPPPSPAPSTRKKFVSRSPWTA